MRNIVVSLVFLIFGIQNVVSQTFLERKIEYYKQKQIIQDKKIAEIELTSVNFERLQKMKIDTSKIDLDNFQERKQIVVLFQTEKKHYTKLATAIGLNAIGTALMGLGGNMIFVESNNNGVGFGGVLGGVSIFFGSMVNLAAIPVYVSSNKKLKRHRNLKQKLMNEIRF